MIDWQILMILLRKHYGPCRKIDRALGRHTDYAAKIARGEIREPKFADGLRLLDLASDHMPHEVLKRCRL